MPFYQHPFFWTLVKILLLLAFLVNVAGLLTWVDRRLGGVIQDRIGPNRAYIPLLGKKLRVAGLLHTAADGLKFFFKEDFVPPRADKLLFAIAPIISMFPVLAIGAVIPMGDTICPGSIVGKSAAGNTVWPWVQRLGQCGIETVGSGIDAYKLAPITLMVAPLSVGLLYVFAIAGQGIVGAAIAGTSSDNKFSLMGALRAASQMVSYEVAMGLSLVGAMMLYGTIRLDEMVRWQNENAWGVFVQPLACVLFFVAAVAEQKRIPFDLPEAESELVSGYFTEYSGAKFMMFYFAEYAEVVTSSMLLVTIFFGGWSLPFFHRDGLTLAFGDNTIFQSHVPHIWMIIIGVLTFFGKTILLCWFQAVVRWSLPRFRYDQLMKLGWRVLLPASLANILVTGVVWLAISSSSASTQMIFKILGDCTQAVVALAATYGIIRFIIGFFTPSVHNPLRIMSAQKRTAPGGNETLPIQT